MGKHLYQGNIQKSLLQYIFVSILEITIINECQEKHIEENLKILVIQLMNRENSRKYRQSNILFIKQKRAHTQRDPSVKREKKKYIKHAGRGRESRG